MNYRHAFHAGNFADLIKHAAIGLIMDRLTRLPGPLLVVESHAGAGTYDLGGEMARKSGEAQSGVVRLMADEGAPAAFQGLKAAIEGVNPKGGLAVYPGSPVLIAERLRREDEYVGAELRPDDCAVLNSVMAASRKRARGVQTDGFDLVKARASDPRRLLVVIDPPYERPDDYGRIIEAIRALSARPLPATVLIWLPLKDLETFDAFLRRLETLDTPSILVVEARLQPLTDPMRMNGCALVLIDAPADLEADLQTAADWVVRTAGGPKAIAKIWRLED